MPFVEAPQYSHLTYDVLPDTLRVRRPDVLIVEGLNVLQPPAVRPDGSSTGAISDYFDFSVYVDAPIEEIRTWYVERFLRLRQTAFALPQSYFHRYAGLSDEEARSTALGDLGAHQRAEPRRERAAHPRAGDAGADQGRRPRGDADPAAEDLSRRPTRAGATRGTGQYQCGERLFQKSRALHGVPYERLM